MRARSRNVLALGLVALLSGCGDDPAQEAEDVHTWVTSGSPPAVFTQIEEPIAIALGERSFPDASCPSVEDDGVVLVIRGGCTTAGGEARYGEARVERGTDDAGAILDRVLRITLDGYGRSTGLGDLRTTGEAQTRPTTGDTTVFDVDVTTEARPAGRSTTTTRYRYEGYVTGGYHTRETIWSGSGEIERRGERPTGVVDVSTELERFDGEVCSGQPIEGATHVTVGELRYVVTYDGVHRCSDDHPAAWSRDGVAQGTLTGVICSARPGGRGGAGAVASIVALGLALLSARRFRPRRLSPGRLSPARRRR